MKRLMINIVACTLLIASTAIAADNPNVTPSKPMMNTRMTVVPVGSPTYQKLVQAGLIRGGMNAGQSICCSGTVCTPNGCTGGECHVCSGQLSQ